MASFKTAYGPKSRVAAPNSGGPSRTKQASADECDINQMMARYQKTGHLPLGMGVGRYGDFDTVDDFLSAQLIVKTAELQFNSLPAEVRGRFNNQPQALLAFIQDPANLEEARKLGLLKEEIKPKAVEAPVPVPNPK